MDEPVVENPLTLAFWINVALVIIGSIVLVRLVQMTNTEDNELFNPYTILEIPVGSTERVIKSAYRKMAKM